MNHSLSFFQPNDFQRPIGILEFEGVAKDGSEGNDDAMYIVSTIQDIVSQQEMAGLIVDFSRITYKFGNMMMKAMALKDEYGFEYLPEDLPVATIHLKVSKQKNILEWFFRREIEENNCFENMDDALNCIINT